MSEAAETGRARKMIEVADDSRYADIDRCTPILEHYRPDLANVMLPHGLISDRAQRMAEDIYNDYDFANGARLHMLCVLKGGHEFFSDLIMHLKKLLTTGCKHVPIGFDFIRVKSYSNMESSGKPTIEATGTDLSALKGKHVLVVEDIIDTGTTMSMLVPHLSTFGAQSVRVATLLQKRTPKSIGFKGDYHRLLDPREVRRRLLPRLQRDLPRHGPHLRDERGGHQGARRGLSSSARQNRTNPL